jgi:lipid-A-disaccharide synthase
MLRAAGRLLQDYPGLVPVTAIRREIGFDYYRKLEQRERVETAYCPDDRYGLLREAEVSVVASGTATLEAALCGRPFCVVYRTGFLTYLIARSLINLDMVGLVNIVAGRKIVPEFLQQNLTARNLRKFCAEMLFDKRSQDRMMDELSRIREQLGEPGAAERAAEKILSEFDG